MSIFLYLQQASIGFILHAVADSSQCGLCNHDHSSRLLMCSFLLFPKIRTVNWRRSAHVARVLSETMSSLCFEHACPSSSQPPDSHHNTKCIQNTYSYLVFFSVYNWAEWPFSQLGIKTKHRSWIIVSSDTIVIFVYLHSALFATPPHVCSSGVALLCLWLSATEAVDKSK